MQIKSIKQTKTRNLIRHLFFFIVLIDFSFSTLDKTNINSNFDRDLILNKLILEDISFVLKDLNFFDIKSKINDEKKTIIDKKSLEDFNKTLTYKLINEIYIKVTSLNNEILIIKETNVILKILIENISEISEMNIYNYFYIHVIFNLIGIFSNYKNDDYNLKNFNEKIIPITYEIICNENKKHINDMNNLTKYSFLNHCISIFEHFTINNNFFFNLEKNEKMKKLFIKIIDEYISFVIKGNDFLLCSRINYYFFNELVLEIIKKNDSCKKIYFELIDCFLRQFQKIFSNQNINSESFSFISSFLENLFENTSYSEKTTNLDILINILKNIADIELAKNKINIYSLSSIHTIQFYTKYILNISEENNQKSSKIIEFFEDNIIEYIKFIKSFKINPENYIFHNKRYQNINRYLYNSNINFENDKFNKKNLIKNIKDTFYKYVEKILNFELNCKDNEVKGFKNNYIIYDFLPKSPTELEKYNFNNIISNEFIKLLEKFHKTIENQEFSKNIYFTNKDKYIIKCAFGYEFVDINEVENSDLFCKFLETYNNKNISIYINNVKIIELFNILNSYETLPKKLSMKTSLKNNFSKKSYKLIFETEIQEFIDNNDGDIHSRGALSRFQFGRKIQKCAFR